MLLNVGITIDEGVLLLERMGENYMKKFCLSIVSIFRVGFARAPTGHCGRYNMHGGIEL